MASEAVCSSVRQFAQSPSSVVVITSSYGDLSARVGAVLTAASLQKVGLRVGLAVGSTPSGALRALDASAQNGIADISHCQFFVLDEFFAEPVDAARTDNNNNNNNNNNDDDDDDGLVLRGRWPAEKSGADTADEEEDGAGCDLPAAPHYAELQRSLLHAVSARQVVRPDSLAGVRAFAEQLAHSPLDVVLVGVGPAGEIGWTQLPDAPRCSAEQLQAAAACGRPSALLLDISGASTYKNQRYASCVSASLATLMRARHVVLMALSRNKAALVRRIVAGDAPDDALSPAALLFRHHPSVQLFVNDTAAALLDAPLPGRSAVDDDDVFDNRILLLRNSQRFLGGERVVCFSPHPDDTSISAGATLAMLAEYSNKVTSCVATTGHRAFIPNTDREERVRIREREASEEAARLGADCEFLRLPLYESGRLADDDVFIIESYLRLKAPTAVFLPHTADTHPTHREVTRGILTALRNIFLSQQQAASLLASPARSPVSSASSAATTTIDTVRIFMYEGPWSLFPPGAYNCVVSPPASAFEKKLAAIRAHHSQVDRTAYDKAADALATMRAVLVPEQDLAGFGGMPPRIEAKIELFYFYPLRSTQDVDLLLSWFDERKPPSRSSTLRL